MSSANTAVQPAVCVNYIGGNWRRSKSSHEIEKRNPANLRDILGISIASSRLEATDAVAAASRALPAWRDTPAPIRGELLLRAAKMIREKTETLAQLITREEGKTLAEAKTEVRLAIDALEYFAGDGRRLCGQTLPSENPELFAYTTRHPVGVIALITPWNFPLAVPAWKIAPALVCGNTVVWKPSTVTPFISNSLAEIFAAAGTPPGVLNLIHGRGREVGEEIIDDPRVRGISFTSSVEVGIGINTRAVQQWKKVQSETGGKNPVIILDDADLNLAVESTVIGAFGYTGQRCTATSRAVVVDGLAQEFVERLVARTRNLTVGNGVHPETDMGPVVDSGQCARILEYIEAGKLEAELVSGGRRLQGKLFDDGYFIEPTIFDHVPVSSRIGQEEIFGPVLSVIRVRDTAAALDVANKVRYGMTASVFTRDMNRIHKFVTSLECGIVHVNSPTIGSEVQFPFGGIKDTSIGDRELGASAINFYSEAKVVYVRYGA
jgi:acyl-CoA reductase-like NAD-dependent aldehyde dehydrogenase